MSKATSFLGEYSIGLSIVPVIKELLQTEYRFVTAIFPWMTREGSNISKVLHKTDQFKIFGVYPRRPKLKYECEDIEIKLNGQIIAGALQGADIGIPIIAGCPLVKNFWEFSENPNFLWINLALDIYNDVEFIIEKGKDISPELSSKLLEKQDILNFIIERAKLFSIEEAVNAFREINMKSMNLNLYPRFGIGGVYKPIYFLLKD
jgi:hypothetical protein